MTRCPKCGRPLRLCNTRGVCARCARNHRCAICNAVALSIKGAVCSRCREVLCRTHPSGKKHEGRASAERIQELAYRAAAGVPLFPGLRPRW
jgi:hypothetical protein